MGRIRELMDPALSGRHLYKLHFGLTFVPETWIL